LKKFFLLFSLIITQVLGDIGLSRGMKDFGAIDTITIASVQHLLVFVFTNIWIWLGILSLVISMVLYLTAISELDLSYVLPIHAFSYVLNAFCAAILLKEQIPVMRWLGIATITLGVILVGLTKGQSEPIPRSKLMPAFMLPLGVFLSKTWLAIFVMSLADASGDILMAKGMKEINKAEVASKQLIMTVVTNTNIIGGIFSQGIAFFTFISALSWADISLIRPASALTYLFSMLGAKFILKERFVVGRLAGIFLITVGVFWLAD
jgi:bacterial/archaeal transporter family protein